MFVFPIVPWFPYSKRKSTETRNTSEKADVYGTYIYCYIYQQTTYVLGLEGMLFFFFGLAQYMFNLYRAKEIPTGKITIKIAQIF